MTFTEVESRVAEAITQGLREGLVHPGDPSKDQPAVAIPIPAFRTGSMPPEMAEHVTTTARLIGEAIVHRIKDVAALGEREPELPLVPDGRVVVYCRCQQPLTRLITRNNVATVDAKAFTADLQRHQCR